MTTCFVVMGFGKKTDFETGRVLDLDKTYHNVIKPAVEELGIECIRADEIVHSGVIDVPMYEYLLKADIVIADLSAANRNAYYELGVRHVLKPHTTVIIAEDGTKPPFPFDVNHILIQPYRHMGEDLGFTETMRFRGKLKELIPELLRNQKIDSPVYTFLGGLTVVRELQGARGNVTEPILGGVGKGKSLATRLSEVDRARDFGEKKQLLEAILADTRKAAAELQNAERERRITEDKKRAQEGGESPPWSPLPEPTDEAYLLQRLALATYKSGAEEDPEPLRQALEVLAPLKPRTSNDTETLGLWGAVHKRLWALTRDRAHLDESIRAYERGFYIRNDYYNGINFAYMLNERAKSSATLAEAIADFVQAQRVRGEVVPICEEWLAQNSAPDSDAVTAAAMKKFIETEYWVRATMAEAVLGSAHPEEADSLYELAYQMGVDEWLRKSTRDQRATLEALLADSPIQKLV